MLAVALLAAAPSLAAAAKGWETVKQERTRGNAVATDPEFHILAEGGIIYVTTTRHLHVKVFTILGSRITDETLAPGSYQFAVPTHGVYIIKAGDLTCKVAL